MKIIFHFTLHTKIVIPLLLKQANKQQQPKNNPDILISLFLIIYCYLKVNPR